jgi:hypothetical protein
MNRRVVFVLILSTVGCVFARPQQEKTDFANLAILEPQLIHLQSQFEQMRPPGISIEAKEVFRKGIPGIDLMVGYNIYIKGAPPDSVFHQIQWPVDREKPFAGFSGLTLNKDGMLICAGRTPGQCHNGDSLDSPMVFAMKNPLKGEPRRFVFIAGDLKVPISIVPYPVQSEDNGCKLTAIRLSARFELALIEGSGFPPDSEVRLHMSAGEGPAPLSVTVNDNGTAVSTLDTSAGVDAKTDRNGVIQTAVLTNTTKNPTGVETVEATGPNCSPKINYKWGVF